MNAEIILVRPDGSVILQVRDDKPGISNRGLVSTFGGHVEPGEAPIDAAWREVNEETNLNIQHDQLILYGKYYKTKEIHGEDREIYYFIARDIDDSKLEVYEGQGAVTVRNLKELAKLKPTILLSEVLADFFGEK